MALLWIDIPVRNNCRRMGKWTCNNRVALEARQGHKPLHFSFLTNLSFRKDLQPLQERITQVTFYEHARYTLERRGHYLVSAQ